MFCSRRYRTFILRLSVWLRIGSFRRRATQWSLQRGRLLSHYVHRHRYRVYNRPCLYIGFTEPQGVEESLSKDKSDISIVL